MYIVKQQESVFIQKILRGNLEFLLQSSPQNKWIFTDVTALDARKSAPKKSREENACGKMTRIFSHS